MLTHCRRTGDLDESSVLWMQARNGEKPSGVRFWAMDSSSEAPMVRVSRSESLFRQEMTRDLMSCGSPEGDLIFGGDISVGSGALPGQI